jgi:hypothetical protein
MSTDLSDGQMITTLFGRDVEVTIDGPSVYINDAMVTVKDIEGSNGVVHVINAVLLPPIETGIESLIFNTNSITVFPNPVDTYLNIDFEITEAGNIDISIFDFTGRKVQTLINNSYSNGNYTITSNIENLSSGFYFISISDGTNKIVKTINKK